MKESKKTQTIKVEGKYLKQAKRIWKSVMGKGLGDKKTNQVDFATAATILKEKTY